jgi:hypothetical protein
MEPAAQHPQAQPPGTPSEDELCGVKPPNLKRAANETFVQHVMRATQTGVTAWKTALTDSEDPRSQAVGLALENAHPDAPGHTQSQDTPVNNRLVLLASETNDPVVYALALNQCGEHAYNMAVGPCQGLSWEHWANIDSDNAAPWLAVAGKAASAGDQQGAEAALAKASMASHYDTYGGMVNAIALNALPRDSAPLDKAVAGADVTSALGINIPTTDITAKLCSTTAIQDPTRKQQCTSYANDLIDSGTGIFDVLVAMNLARTLGLPKDLQADLEKEMRGLRTRTALTPWRYTHDGSTLNLLTDFGCDNVLGYDDYIDALQASGGNERAALATLNRPVQSVK